MVQIWVQIWILLRILRISQQNVMIWGEADFCHWPSGSLLFPPLIPSCTERGLMCMHMDLSVYTSQFCPQPPANSRLGHPLGVGICVWVVWSILWRANPGKRSMWALEVGLESLGQGIPRYLEYGPESDWGYGQKRPGLLTPWDRARKGPEWSLPKHRAQSRGHQYTDVSISSVYKVHKGRAGVILIY